MSTTDVDVGDSGDGDDIRELTIGLVHRPNVIIHIVFYEDNDDSASLTCGDTIISTLTIN